MQSLERLTCGTKRLKCTKAMSYVTLFFSFFYIVSRQKICYVCKFKFFNVCHLWQFLWNIFRLNIRSPLPTDCWLENLFLSVTNFLSFQQFPDESISGVHLYLNRETLPVPTGTAQLHWHYGNTRHYATPLLRSAEYFCAVNMWSSAYLRMLELACRKDVLGMRFQLQWHATTVYAVVTITQTSWALFGQLPIHGLVVCVLSFCQIVWNPDRGILEFGSWSRRFSSCS